MQPEQPPTERKAVAWQPFTPRGVAAFASAKAGRLLLAQLAVAIVVAATSVWLVRKTWVPAVTAAINRLPAEGEIADGKLAWPPAEPETLGENRYLAISVDPRHGGAARSPAHISIEFGERDVKVYSLFGYVQAEYPREYRFALNKPEVLPAWGAWRAPLLWILSGSVIAGLFMLWWLLACVYTLPVLLVAFFANRRLRISEACKLGGASMLAPALFLCICILLYGFSVIDPVQLLAAEALHLVLGLIYVTWAITMLPPASVAATVENPFAAKQ
jgi:hypothetical protein